MQGTGKAESGSWKSPGGAIGESDPGQSVWCVMVGGLWPCVSLMWVSVGQCSSESATGCPPRARSQLLKTEAISSQMAVCVVGTGALGQITWFLATWCLPSWDLALLPDLCHCYHYKEPGGAGSWALGAPTGRGSTLGRPEPALCIWTLVSTAIECPALCGHGQSPGKPRVSGGRGGPGAH